MLSIFKPPNYSKAKEGMMLKFLQEMGDDKKYSNRYEKHAFGICLTRFNEKSNHYEVLLVKRKHSFCYVDFVLGKYSSDSDIIKLLKNITIEEAFDIWSLDFKQMWYRIWINDIKPEMYERKKVKFKKIFLKDGGTKLRGMLKSINYNNVIDNWEFPKGHKKIGEHKIECALREFLEETKIHITKIHLYFEVSFNETFTSDNVKYSRQYYLAIPNTNIIPEVRFDDITKQISEVVDIRWFSLNDIKIFDRKDRLKNVAKFFIEKLKKRRKNKCAFETDFDLDFA
jgi:8-oxo-dGTP pyrophosphatase MutT (NUDIX family)